MLRPAVGVISAEMYEALILANVPEDKARAAAAEVAKGQDLASKADLVELGAQLRSEMDKGFAQMDKRFAEMDNRMDKRFAEMDNRMDKRFAGMDNRMDKRFAGMDKRTDERFAEMDKRFDKMDKRFDKIMKSLLVLKIGVFSQGSVILALLIKLVFFP